MKKTARSKAVKATTKPGTRNVPAKSAPGKAATTKAVSRAATLGNKQAAKPSVKRTATKTAPSAAAPDLYSSLHALLHTMRVIEQHEEPLCSMQDELRRTGKLSAAHRRRLQQVVDELPAADYQHDLETLRQAVAA